MDLLPDGGHPELVIMVNERDRFWVLQGGRDWDYELLVYGDHRIVVPRSGRHALLQAAHAASHQGLGRMRDLLEKSFYWPRMDLDAQRYIQVCFAARRKGIAPPLAHDLPYLRRFQTRPHREEEPRRENEQPEQHLVAEHDDRCSARGQGANNERRSAPPSSTTLRNRRRRQARAARRGLYRQQLPHSQCLNQQLNGLRRGILHPKV